MRIINWISEIWMVRRIDESRAMKWMERHASILFDVWLGVIVAASIAEIVILLVC